MKGGSEQQAALGSSILSITFTLEVVPDCLE